MLCAAAPRSRVFFCVGRVLENFRTRRPVLERLPGTETIQPEELSTTVNLGLIAMPNYCHQLPPRVIHSSDSSVFVGVNH